jgi:hypothetical protein|tara:strand:- start:1022 stop:1426 length:405 start_codon:yes stop_codon:yes gene_type:complete
MSNFKINPDKPMEITNGDTEESVSDLYSIMGKHDWLDEEGFPRLNSENVDAAQVHAKVVKDSNRNPKFYAKRGRHGRFFNPIGLYSEGTEYKQTRHAGHPEWELKSVSQKAFSFYINFLKTKNTAWLSNAEREV